MIREDQISRCTATFCNGWWKKRRVTEVRQEKVTEERGVGPKERSFSKGQLMASEAIMIEQIMSLKQRGSSTWRLRQGNTQRKEGGHVSRNHKVNFRGGFYTFVSFKSRDKDFTKKSHLGGAFAVRTEGMGETFITYANCN